MTDLKFDLAEILPMFAPEIRLHPGDPYRPSSVEWYLERTTLQRWRGVFRRNEVVCISGERLGLVAEIESEDQAALCLTIPEGPNQERSRRGFQPTDGKLSAPCYVNACFAPDEPDAFDLQYWFFYPFNGRGGRHVTHEGDWEHITVRVTNAPMPILIAAYVSAHGMNNGGWVSRGDGELQVTDPGHPIIYSAIGSHASYTTAGVHKQRWPKPGDRTRTGGPVWNTADDLVLVEINGQSPDGLEDAHPWLRYRGRWGAIRSGFSWPFATTGPIGPSQQQSWIAEPPRR